jgi:alpha-tubulin suppressor-like RCC1 family protein
MNSSYPRFIPVTFALASALVCNCASAALQKVISGGIYHSVMLKEDGTVWAWGNNSGGQLGNNSTVHSSIPVQVVTSAGALTGIVKIDAGGNHALALKDDGTLWAWGGGYYGQLGVAGNANSLVAVQVKDSTGSGYLAGVVDIDAGTEFSTALAGNGTMYVWGRNNVLQLGDGTYTNSNLPKAVSLGQAAVKIAAGGSSSFAILADGTVKAWGAGGVGQLGMGAIGDKAVPTTVPGLTGVSKIAGGVFHSLALMNDGTVKSWGWHALGNGTYGSSSSPVNVSNLTGVTEISAGWGSSFAIRGSDKTGWAWGLNSDGRLGIGSLSTPAIPTQIAVVSNVEGIAAALGYFSLVGSEDGSIWASGVNDFGQLGDGVQPERKVPEQVPALGPLRTVSSRYDHVLALRHDGGVWAWGANGGKLGNGAAENSSTPVAVSDLNDAVEISAGDYFSLARRSNGTVLAWGEGWEGMLGNGSDAGSAIPVAVSGISNATKVSAGTAHGLALLSDGSVKSWGYGYDAQLGNGAASSSNVPVSVSSLSSGVSDVSAGDYFSLALKAGEVWAWGGNYAGELGDGTTTTRLTPVKVPGLSNVTAISAGASYALAVSNGEVWAWGNNATGNLGDGTTTNRTAPVRAGTLTGVIAVKAGQNHSMALKSDGTVWAWGYNGAGQIGNDSVTNQLTPVLVTRLEGATAITNGNGTSFAIKEDGRISAWGRSPTGTLADNIVAVQGSPILVPGVNRKHDPPVLTMSPADATVAPMGSDAIITGSYVVGDAPVDSAFFYSRGIEMNVDAMAPFAWSFRPDSYGDIEINQIGMDFNGATSRPKSIRLRVPYDHDSDDMPDWWEVEHFGAISATPSGDTDGDGVSNAAEFAAGTSPMDADTDGDGIPDLTDPNPLEPATIPLPSASGQIFVWAPLEK